MADFDWDAIRFFLAAVREGSFTGAARTLRVKHTTVGRRVAELEEAVGTPLFRRTRDGLHLTEAGQAVRPIAEDIERSTLRFGEAAEAGERLTGVVRLALSEAFMGLIVEHLVALRAEHPGLVVDVVISDSRADLVRDGADLAIRMGPLEEKGLVCSKLGAFGWSLYASASYLNGRPPLPWASIGECDVIGYDAALAHSPGARWLDAHAGTARVVVRCNSILGARAAALAGMGVCALPCFVAAELERVTPEVIGSRDAFLVLHPDRQHTARVRVVMEHLRKVIAENRALMSGEARPGRL